MLLDHKIIVLADGIHGNVIKLKPPMVVTKEDCDGIVQAVDSVLTKLIWLILLLYAPQLLLCQNCTIDSSIIILCAQPYPQIFIDNYYDNIPPNFY